MEVVILFTQLPNYSEDINEILNLRVVANQILNFIYYSEVEKDILIVNYKNIHDYLISFKINILNYIDKLIILLIEEYKRLYSIYENKINYINHIRDGIIKIKSINLDYLNNILTSLNYLKIDDSYDYLIDMPIRSLTNENINLLTNKLNKLDSDINYLENITSEEYYISELETLEKQLKLSD